MNQLVDAIHIGFPKTATSWLQGVVIPRISVIRSLGRPALVDLRYQFILEDLVRCDPLEFDSRDFQSRFQQLHEENREALGPGTVKVISYEFLTGREIYAGLDAKELLDRVLAVFGRVRIVITIREQKSMIESVYRHYVGSGGSLPLRELLFKRSSPGVDSFGTRCLLAKFRYDNTIRYCHQLFGRDQVKVIPYEWIRTQPQRFAGEFASFLGVVIPASIEFQGDPMNRSLSYTGISVLRWINQIVGTPLSDSPVFRLVPAMYNRFIGRMFGPTDRLIFGKIMRRKRFVNRRLKWFWRRVFKRLVTGVVTPRRVESGAVGTETRRRLESSLRVNLFRWLDWPEVDQVYGPAGFGYNAQLDDTRICDYLDEEYAASNTRTQELTNLPLAELGYSVSASASPTDPRTSA